MLTNRSVAAFEAAPITAVCAVVPAHDEEELIGRCLLALVRAARVAKHEHPGVALRIVIVADDCTDATALRAAQVTGIDVVTVKAATVGTARAEGIDYALGAFAQQPVFAGSLASLWIANTDADAAVPENWLTEQIHLADAGADAVIGTVIPGSAEGRVRGANLGVRGANYRRVGGFSSDADHADDLVSRLRFDGARVIDTTACDVVTAGRPGERVLGAIDHDRYLTHERA